METETILETATCQNCMAKYTLEQRFCSACGQSTRTHRLSTGHILHEFFHAFTHTDKSIIGLAKTLLTRPGFVARAYVEGKRKSLYNPFNFLVVTVALSIIILNMTGVDIFQSEKAGDPITGFMSKHVNLVFFLTVPLAAWFTHLIFRKSGVNFAECAVLCAYTAGERTLFFQVVVVPLIWLLPNAHLWIVQSYLGVYALYYAVACMQFTGQKSVSGFLKGLLVTVLLQISLFVLIGLAIFLYYTLK